MKLGKIAAALTAGALVSLIGMTAADAAQYTSYTWEAGEYWIAPNSEFCIEPKVYCDPGNIMALQFDLATPAIDNVAIMPTSRGDEDGYLGTAYESFADMMFNMEAMHVGGSDSGMGSGGVPAAEDGSTICEMWYNTASEKAVINAANACGLTIQYSDEKSCWYYSFPLDFDPSINEAARSPMCEAVLTNESNISINFVSGSINITISDEAAAAEAAKTTAADSSHDNGSSGSADSNESQASGNASSDNSGSTDGGNGSAGNNEASGSEDVAGEDGTGAADSGNSTESPDAPVNDRAEAEVGGETGKADDEAASDVSSEPIKIEAIGCDGKKDGGSGKTILLVVSGIAVLGAGGGLAAYYFLKKKK